MTLFLCREERKKEKQRRRALLESDEGKEERERRKIKKKKKEEKEKRKKGEQGTAEAEDDCSASKCRRPTGKQVRNWTHSFSTPILTHPGNGLCFISCTPIEV
jgi:hypothetical protein